MCIGMRYSAIYPTAQSYATCQGVGRSDTWLWCERGVVAVVGVVVVLGVVLLFGEVGVLGLMGSELSV